jgi:hypothetical protein
VGGIEGGVFKKKSLTIFPMQFWHSDSIENFHLPSKLQNTNLTVLKLSASSNAVSSKLNS